ncbi:hydrolethalus syndrome protein 1 [Numida meleagris]|uniref:hydrolethalus syndrome protein 1 n=1 Tax=Numida meleagris TaxID=8996 RepID=UPI000B3E3746|nr:hydrolethalus syndrome protein 1 [Numida meleagris]XP_021231852.1 hydrolethalus syndrome protein 1 [Numida meleagris]XP_021231853.1 hydrolethalus syndrome protein 1 [Numida meleagris]XP_021231854.1 hydrolethalus syndrome protein 1 [Numida meleagris]XP_021231855.1 hydrolethalus syndrome protein 1 [Numida meleagris]
MENRLEADRHTGAALSDEELEGGSESRGAEGEPLCCRPYAAPAGLQPARPPSTGLPCTEPSAAPWNPTGSRRRVMKRKVLRRRPDGGVEVCDESVTSLLETTDTWNLRQKMLQLSTGPEDSLFKGEIEMSSSFLQEFPPEPSYQHQGTTCDSPFLLRVIQSQSPPTSHCTATAVQPKSFIPPRLDVLRQNRSRSDRVAKYFEYKREWERFPVPGEHQHKDLLWGIRAKMLTQHNFPSKPQRTYVPNTYTVPTDKKRSALRWGVRWDLANGLIPKRNTPL